MREQSILRIVAKLLIPYILAVRAVRPVSW